MGRAVAHLDLDAFFAAVEVLERPELAGVPLVVGGEPRQPGRGGHRELRGAALRRALGHELPPRRAAAARRPSSCAPDHGRYRRHSRRVWALVGERCPAVEQVGIDEGYLDLSSVVASSGEARRYLTALQDEIRGADRALGLVRVRHVEGGREDRLRPSQAAPG